MAYKAEDLNIDQFFNLEDSFASPALAHLNKGKGIITPQFQQPIEKVNTYAPFQTSQTLSGPSHEYGLYKQHIPLPPGAITSSIAAARPLQYNAYSNYGMGSSSGVFDVTEEFLDFGTHRGSTDMDMDFDSPLDTYNGDYLDPNAMHGHEEDSPVLDKVEFVRAYPGMHSAKAQQAALAKQQQQMEIQRQQQQMKQRPQHKPSASKGTNKTPMDPIAEEKIHQLLSQMRQNVNVPLRQTDDQSPPMMRMKKDEEDMDEDERLLASEEGKKLSSKERRQLRNKVSARAFRSRRKEYIGQLEGEVAQKTSEADTLRVENEALKAENIRLTDLTKLLLSSSAFSTFLNDLSTNGLPASIMAPVNPTPAPVLSVTPSPESQHQFTPQPLSNTIIEEDVDFNNLDGNSSWSSGMDLTFAPQVFAVTELPEGPIIDSAFMSGKVSEAKETVPVIQAAPFVVSQTRSLPRYTPDSSIELNEEQFSIFADQPVQSTEESSTPALELFGSVSFEKATESFCLIVDDKDDCSVGEISAITMARFASLNSSLESLSMRLERLICN